MPEFESYHALLIGCDKYPPSQPSLTGCVNDIDAVEQLLLRNPELTSPPTRLKITRLAAPLPGSRSASPRAPTSQLPTRTNIVAALQALAGPNVKADDRVLIHYSGHGGQWQYRNGRGWYECLVPCDEQLLYDDEMNAFVAAIAERTTDVTVV